MLYEKDRYIAPFLYLINKNLQEWDIQKANISILKKKGLLTQSQFDYYLNLPKMKREISIGLLMRDNKQITEAIVSGLMEARRDFFTANNIQDYQVLYIDKDSITYINENPQVISQFGDVRFVCKNQYTSFYRVFDIDLLYYNDGTTERFRLKNTNEQTAVLHKHGLLDLLLAIAEDGQGCHALDTVQMIKSAYCAYARGELPLDYYREFNKRSQFKLKSTSSAIYDYYSHILPTSYGPAELDISYNLEILRLFYKIFITEYFKQIRH